MKYFQKLIGDKCYLSPISIEDAEQYCQWLNDMEVAKYLLYAPQQIGISKERSILEEICSNGDQVYAIVDKATNQLIGNCSLYNIDHLNCNCELGIFIGNKQYWGKGYGTEAIHLLLDYGFNILNLHNIILEVCSYNKRAIRAYEKAGFKKIGNRRGSKVIGGRKYDDVFMDITADEFDKGYLKLIEEE